jgi:putative heme-binding domain-containing protein
VLIRPHGGKWYSFNSDSTWRCTTSRQNQWQSPVYNDRQWVAAKTYGPLGSTAPWDRREEVVSSREHEASERFQIQQGFSVQRLLDDEAIGSVIAMAINEFGHIIASQEYGPLKLIFDADKNGIPESVRTYCDQVNSCQGILPLNGEVYVTGFGPDGAGLYRLKDEDRNGTLEYVQMLVKFVGTPGEHGAHGLTLGPDGMIYITIGNHVKVEVPFAETSPLTTWYEGDLVPRYEDPGGHARGIKAPGGTIVRTDLQGSKVELVAGGLRNAYDLTFHPDGRLLTHDSDMESDVGAAWYQPTVLFDIVEGGEYGWRSGWANWPAYYPDRLPPILDTGRGSPTGAIVYDHYAFPARYQNALFLADWSEGRILLVRMTTEGATVRANSEVFLQGQPLNVTDLCIAQDGSLYFSTGGRGTSGGIYRVVHKTPPPDRLKNLGNGIAAAIRQPQLESAWARQQIAQVKKELGREWNELVPGVATSNENPPHYRVRALDLMQLYGPEPSEDFLIELSRTKSEPVRARVARMMGLQNNPTIQQRLAELLSDRDPQVSRAACESLTRSGGSAPIGKILNLIVHEDRHLAFCARRLLERQPLEKWRDVVLDHNEPRVAIRGSLALMTVEPRQETALAVVKRMSSLIRGDIDDNDFVDLLRTLEVTLHRGKLKPNQLEPLREQLAEEFPAGNPRMCRELMRLIVFLQGTSAAPRALAYLKSDAPLEERVHVAMHLQMLKHEWTGPERFEILKFFEQAAKVEAGSSVPLYLMNATRDFARQNLTVDEAFVILEEGERWPNAALGALYKVPVPISEDDAELLRELDGKLTQDEHSSDVYRRLKTGIVALLATDSSESTQDYLRQIWRTDPERRQPVAMALAQHPQEENWDYLVRSLHILQGAAAQDVLQRLANVKIATDDPEALRQVILLGLRSIEDQESPEAAQRLLVHWTGEQQEGTGETAMNLWGEWYAEQYPDRPPAVLPKPGEDARWDLEQLLEYITSKDGKFGDPLAGKAVFAKAQCAACHRYGREGQTVGPDLTNVAKRFTKREILEAVLFPSHMVSDQYRSRKVLTLDGRTHTGLVSDAGDGTLNIRDSRNQLTSIDENDVDQIIASSASIMPDGLFDSLSLREISDLMAYMGIIPPLEVAGKSTPARK